MVYRKMELYCKLYLTKFKLAFLINKEKVHEFIFGKHARKVVAISNWREFHYPDGEIIRYRPVAWCWRYERFDFSTKEIISGYQLNEEEGLYLANVEPKDFQNHLRYLEDIYTKADRLCIRLGILTHQMENRK